MLMILPAKCTKSPDVISCILFLTASSPRPDAVDKAHDNESIRHCRMDTCDQYSPLCSHCTVDIRS